MAWWWVVSLRAALPGKELQRCFQPGLISALRKGSVSSYRSEGSIKAEKLLLMQFERCLVLEASLADRGSWSSLLGGEEGSVCLGNAWPSSCSGLSMVQWVLTKIVGLRTEGSQFKKLVAALEVHYLDAIKIGITNVMCYGWGMVSHGSWACLILEFLGC